MKKIITILLVSALMLATFASCGGGEADDKTIKVGASVTPHAEILNAAKEILAADGYTLEVVEFTDYVLPNTSLENGELDANYFQHQLYLDGFNKDNDTHLNTVLGVHYEPFGIYGGKTKAIADLKDGATVSVPNDATNEARALLLLEAQGLIKLADGIGLEATVKDIVENPKNLKISELEAAQLPISLPDVDISVINGNYAIGAGLNAADALAIEDKNDPVIKDYYVNVLVVKEGNEASEKIEALKDALQSEEIKTFIESTYSGAVIPMF